jgi:hypothetical protein
MVTMLFGISFAGYGYFLVAQHRCRKSAASHLSHLAMSVAMILMAWGLGTKPLTIGAIIAFLLASAWFVRVAGGVSRSSGGRLTNYYYAVMMAAMGMDVRVDEGQPARPVWSLDRPHADYAVRHPWIVDAGVST